MQTKLQIEQLLLTAGLRPNKRFGQHFLIDLNLMRLLIENAGIKKNDVVLEVGCATGSLTEAISEKAGFCVAVEIDPAIAEIAKKQLQNHTNVEIIVADVLKNKFEINPAVIDALNRARAIYPGRLLLVANLPYAAATPLMLNLITGSITADAMFVTVQKEVADRMTAKPACPERSRRGTKDYGILSIMLSATGDVKHIRTLRPSVFWPPPQVDSAIIRYIRNAEKLKKIKNIELLSQVAGAFLHYRRKTLKSCCKLMTGERGTGFQPVKARPVHRTPYGGWPCYNWPEIFSRCGIDPGLRPDHLTPDQFVAIANLCCHRDL
jgi:16S rRNA (adenine1518-N6/adenine1519-N6)-dimethyltransferase